MQLICAATAASPSAENEDRFRSGRNWALVLDGAGRYPGHTGGCIHPVTWIVDRLALHLAEQLADEASGSLQTIADRAIRGTAADHGPACDLTDPLSPGATCALIRERRGRLEWFVLGDCAVVLACSDGRHIVVSDDRLERLPSAPVVDAEVRTYDPAYVAQVRNQPGGFWVLSVVPEAAAQGLIGSLPAAEVARVALCSDGVTRLTERYGWQWADVFALAESEGPEAVIAGVREAETDDPDPRRWRGKLHDDATIVVVAP
ncbi:MAG: hypothetical protein HOV87_12230 [Catenulispora sp.]|nr:hypothetical protein [Catenulispora sp.]NUT39985.1 hypothetical protein [Thermoactinospora sp.]